MPAATTRKPERKPDEFYTVVGAADVLKISERSLRTLVQAGEVRAMRLGKRIIRIPRREIERLADAGCSALCSVADGERETNGRSN